MARKRHRVAHIMPWEGVGGTEQAALRIARSVEDAGFDATFFCVRSAPVVRDFFSSAGYDTVMWRDGYPRFNGYRYFIQESLQLAREFRRRGITLVHCADVPAGSFAGLAGRLALVPGTCTSGTGTSTSPSRTGTCSGRSAVSPSSRAAPGEPSRTAYLRTGALSFMT